VLLLHEAYYIRREVELSNLSSSSSSSSQLGTRKAAVRILKNFDEAITVDASSLDPEVLYQRPYAG
jgi:A-kinase anchor protein 10